MSRIKYQATDSLGKVHTRTTNSRVYTHVVVVHLLKPARDVVEWAGRYENAQNVFRRWDRALEFRQDIDDIEILAAERVA